jgi:hypothetical protein
LRGRPGLGRIVVPELVGDDLVHGDVETRVDRPSPDDHFVIAATEGAVQLRMLDLEQDPALVRIGGIEVLELDLPVAAACRRANEMSPRFLG